MLDRYVDLLFCAINKEFYEGENADAEWAKAIQVWDIYKSEDSEERTNALECNLALFPEKQTRGVDKLTSDCELGLDTRIFVNTEGNICEDFKIGLRK